MRSLQDFILVLVLCALMLPLLGQAQGLDHDSASCPEVTGQGPLEKLKAKLPHGQALIQEKKYQEAAWVLEEAGQEERSQEVLASLKKTLSHGRIQEVRKLGTGVSESYVVVFADGIKGIFKPAGPKHAHKREIAAYIMDRLLGLNLVPMTVERKVQGRAGSLQYFLRDVRTGEDARDVPLHELKLDRLRLFDVLISNNDRHARNYLVLSPQVAGQRRSRQNVVAIDHNLIFGSEAPDMPKVALSEAMHFAQGLRRLAHRRIDQEFKGLLDETDLARLHYRRDQLLQELCTQHAKACR